ncbi:hypothetical protein S83_036582 [Arachis hypogaea]
MFERLVVSLYMVLNFLSSFIHIIFGRHKNIELVISKMFAEAVGLLSRECKEKEDILCFGGSLSSFHQERGFGKIDIQGTLYVSVKSEPSKHEEVVFRHQLLNK